MVKAIQKALRLYKTIFNIHEEEINSYFSHSVYTHTLMRGGTVLLRYIFSIDTDKKKTLQEKRNLKV